ncbi:hypothetical protein N5079_21290 [Planotetraspora sp. A-T 1434]|uniref:choice-of-anchor P family protein n=1 Tax=Planotetraspora sp. A-T 1434 TaxID=2979219 RepID=UPI0021C23B83|nr:choice-of-anchor P family protein [Planotetraspora sp. A-T 1434]MCT9932742.1 hypothetical protein [Planotetraspora sp. A-T 1434]
MNGSHVRGPGSGPGRRVPAGLAALAASVSLVAATQGGALAAPGSPGSTAGHLGTPKAPVTVFAEDFENGQGPTPILVTDYTGAAPVKETYTADPIWLTSCNGWIASQRNPATPPPSAGCGGWWTSVKQLAGTLGRWAGGDPAANHAVTAYTNSDPGPNKTQLETSTPIAIGARDRFLAFSVDVAETNCHGNHAKLGFYLLDGATAVPTFTTPIEPCAQATTTLDGIRVGTFTSNSPVLFDGSTVGLRLVNFQGSGYGNDAAFDNVRVLDVTPQLGIGFGSTPAEVGTDTPMKFTITNTSELAVKRGWSFTENLPAGLTVGRAAATTDCAGATVTAPAAGGRITVTGTLAAGKESCTATVPVTSKHARTYTTCPDDLTSYAGVNPPACADVRFAAPVLVFDAHAHGGRVTAPLVSVAPLAPSDLTCTQNAGRDGRTLLSATLSTLGSVGVITTSTAGTVDPDGLRMVRASAETSRVNLLGGLVTADTVTAVAKAQDDDTGLVSTGSEVRLANLRVNGVTINEPGANLVIDIPLVGKITINERVPIAGGRGVVVNAVHVHTTAGTDIIVSHARAALTLPGQPCPTV